MQIITGNHFLQEFPAKNKEKNEESHQNKSSKNHNDVLANPRTNNLSVESNKLAKQQKNDSVSHRETSQSDNTTTSETLYTASATFSFSFTGSVEDSNRLLFSSISQKLATFESSNTSQPGQAYNSNIAEFDFKSFEETTDLLISRIRQIAGSFGLPAIESANDDAQHGETGNLSTPVVPSTISPNVNDKDSSTPLLASVKPEPTLEKLSSAITAGFQESKDVVQQYGTFSADVGNAFAKIRQRLDDVLNSLTQPSSAVRKSQTINANYFKYDASSETSIQIRTNDGDTVNINFSSSSQQEYTDGSFQSHALSANGFSYESRSQSNYSFSVEGNLDDGELKAIEKLVSGIQKAATSYSPDDIASALTAIANDKFDASELRAYQFESKTVEEIRAVSLYQQLAEDETETKSFSNPSIDGHINLAIGSILDLLADAQKANIAEPKEMIHQLLEEFNSQANSLLEQNIASPLRQNTLDADRLNLVA